VGSLQKQQLIKHKPGREIIKPIEVRTFFKR